MWIVTSTQPTIHSFSQIRVNLLFLRQNVLYFRGGWFFIINSVEKSSGSQNRNAKVQANSMLCTSLIPRLLCWPEPGNEASHERKKPYLPICAWVTGYLELIFSFRLYLMRPGPGLRNNEFTYHGFIGRMCGSPM